MRLTKSDPQETKQFSHSVLYKFTHLFSKSITTLLSYYSVLYRVIQSLTLKRFFQVIEDSGTESDDETEPELGDSDSKFFLNRIRVIISSGSGFRILKEPSAIVVVVFSLS